MRYKCTNTYNGGDVTDNINYIGRQVAELMNHTVTQVFLLYSYCQEDGSEYCENKIEAVGKSIQLLYCSILSKHRQPLFG